MGITSLITIEKCAAIIVLSSQELSWLLCPSQQPGPGTMETEVSMWRRTLPGPSGLWRQIREKPRTRNNRSRNSRTEGQGTQQRRQGEIRKTRIPKRIRARIAKWTKPVSRERKTRIRPKRQQGKQREKRKTRIPKRRRAVIEERTKLVKAGKTSQRKAENQERQIRRQPKRPRKQGEIRKPRTPKRRRSRNSRTEG